MIHALLKLKDPCSNYIASTAGSNVVKMAMATSGLMFVLNILLEIYNTFIYIASIDV